MYLILESTPNPYAARLVMCHINITGGKAALQGGELWFGTDGVIYINYKSGRYGAMTDEHRQTVVEYFNYVKYERVVVME